MASISFISKITRKLSNRYKSKIFTPSFIPSHEPVKRTYATVTAKNSEMLRGLHVKVTSREMIKPSSPTPRHLKTVRFSLLDQLQPSYHLPIILFYNNNDDGRLIDQSNRTVSLKKSLSETLVHFYPLAGRIQGNTSIECDDQGVEFREAYVSDNITNAVKNPNLEDLQVLVPFRGVHDSHENLVLSVQVNHFSCGGMAIGVCISHKIADGSGSIEFLRAWSATAMASSRGIDGCHVHVTRPEFNGASIFPPLAQFNHIPSEEEDDGKEKKGKLVSKRLIFDKTKLDELKSNINRHVKATSVEIVTAFIWKHLMTKFPSEFSSALHAVNLRTRTVPAIRPQDCFGNFVLLSSTNPLINGREKDYPELIDELRKAIKRVDNNYLDRLLKSDQRLLELKRESDNINHGANKYCFTSMCRCPIYEVNFGMGNPIWACHTPPPVENLIILWSTKCGQGIEAWIHMLEDDLAMLDLDFS